MPSFNRTILLGHLTRDPELRYTPKGTAVVKCALAVNRTWKNEAGEKQEDVAFIDFTAWGRRGEVIAQYTRKGLPLMIDGHLKQETWEDKQTGQKKSKLIVIVENFSLIEFADRAEQGRPAPAAAKQPARAESKPEPSDNDGDLPPREDDDVPF